ncbi:hypothetical protein ACWC09_38370 [Streptomyces sp. NPDC001617]
MSRPGAGSAGRLRVTRRSTFDRRASTQAGTGSGPNAEAMSWQAGGP